MLENPNTRVGGSEVDSYGRGRHFGSEKTNEKILHNLFSIDEAGSLS